MITYLINGYAATKSEIEWFFGKQFVTNLTASAKRMNKRSGETVFKFWQDGTGYLTIMFE